ncbi:MAG: hypothetical protein F7C35_03300 [Desulfurococcales archaeon]|nr:hypothetical protein [Desulfurococcales archaeon]
MHAVHASSSLVVHDDVGDVNATSVEPGFPTGSADIRQVSLQYDTVAGQLIYEFNLGDDIPKEGIALLLETQFEVYRPGGITTTFTTVASIDYIGGHWPEYSYPLYIIQGHPVVGDVVYQGGDRVQYNVTGDTIVLKIMVDYNATPLPDLGLPHLFRGSITVQTVNGTVYHDSFTYESQGQTESRTGGPTETTTQNDGGNTQEQGTTNRETGGSEGAANTDVSSKDTEVDSGSLDSRIAVMVVAAVAIAIVLAAKKAILAGASRGL